MDICFKAFAVTQQRLAFLLLIIGLCSSCTSQQLYATGQAFQRNQCLNRPESGERDKCLSNANSPYEDYKRQANTEHQND